MAILVCPCGHQMRPETNGIQLLELTGSEPKDGKPYRIWRADLMKCPDCGNEIAWTDAKPIERHYHGFQSDWDVALEQDTSIQFY